MKKRKLRPETFTVRGRECVPADKVARRVTAPGIHYVPEMPASGVAWDAPPPVGDPPYGMEYMLGQRRGKMVIIGYLGSFGKPNRTRARAHKWLARCDCGKYELRDGYQWRRGARLGFGDECMRCNRLTLLKRTDERRARDPRPTDA